MSLSAVPSSFACTLEPGFDRVVVRVRGELDLAVAPDLQSTLVGLLDRGWPRVMVDLRELTFLDSSGLHALLDVRSAAVPLDCRFSLVRGPEVVDRVFELTGTEGFFAFDAPPVV